MKIILYKKCILSNSYSEVFDVFHKTKDPLTNEETVALQRYLSSLTKYEITADNVYVPNSGKITLELDFDYENVSNNIYEYNYMYLEDTDNNFRRYCFIDDITVVNGLAVISFSEDIWSNYASSMEIRKSLLVRSRVTKYGSYYIENGIVHDTRYNIPFYSIGMEYEGNNPLIVKNRQGEVTNNGIIKDSNIPDNRVAMGVTIQVYNLTEAGKNNTRDIYTGIVPVGLTSPNNQRDVYGTPSQFINRLNFILEQSNSQQVTINNEKRYYEVMEVYAIPRDFNILKNKVNTADALFSIKITDNWTDYFLIKNIFNSNTDNTLNEGNKLFNKEGELIHCTSFEYENDFKRLGIGLFSNIIPVVNNGTKTNIEVYFKRDYTQWGFYFNIQNKLINITQDLLVEAPISVQSADVTQQQAAARELKAMNAKMSIAGGAIGIANGIVGTAVGVGSSVMAGVGTMHGPIQSRAGYGVSVIQNAGNAQTSFNSGIGGGIMQVIQGAKELEIANREMFSTTKGVSSISDGLLNARIGIVELLIDSDNDIEVQANIDNTGYICNEIVDNLFIKPLNEENNVYNVMRFDYVNIYGAFTQKIARILRKILLDGFKIWYDETQINV